MPRLRDASHAPPMATLDHQQRPPRVADMLAECCRVGQRRWPAALKLQLAACRRLPSHNRSPAAPIPVTQRPWSPNPRPCNTCSPSHGYTEYGFPKLASLHTRTNLSTPDPAPIPFEELPRLCLPETAPRPTARLLHSVLFDGEVYVEERHQPAITRRIADKRPHAPLCIACSNAMNRCSCRSHCLNALSPAPPEHISSGR